MLGYPAEACKMWNKYLEKVPVESISLFHILRASAGYPIITNLKKKARESTDLAEYIFLGTNNFSQLQIVKKLELCQDGQKGKLFLFFYTNMLDPGIWVNEIR